MSENNWETQPRKDNGEFTFRKKGEAIVRTSGKIPTFKRGLKKTDAIADYMESKLRSMGYDVERKHSGLSGSEYLTLKNVGDLFDKAEVDDVEIRISDHNLPPTYDIQYQGDFDIKSNDVNRSGTNGDAMDYEDLLKYLYKKRSSKIIETVKAQNKKEIIKQKEIKKALPEWAKNKKGIQDKMNSMKDFNSQFYLKQILREPSQKEREKKILEVLQSNDDEIKKMYTDFFD